MILLNSLICLLLIIIFLHFLKFLKDRNSKKEGFSEINNIEYNPNIGIENYPNNKLSPDLHTSGEDLNGELLKKMKKQ